MAVKDVLTHLTRESPRFQTPAFDRPAGADAAIAADPIPTVAMGLLVAKDGNA